MEELKEIKVRRKRLGITQSQLAKLSGVSQSLIAKIEANILDPSYSNAQKIFEALCKLESKNEVTAKEIMRPRIISVPPGSNIKAAIEIMRKQGISQLPVIDHNHVVGFVSEAVIIEHLMEDHSDSVVSDIMVDSPPIVPYETSKQVIASLLRQFPLVLVKNKEALKGIITKADLLDVIV